MMDFMEEAQQYGAVSEESWWSDCSAGGCCWPAAKLGSALASAIAAKHGSALAGLMGAGLEPASLNLQKGCTNVLKKGRRFGFHTCRKCVKPGMVRTNAIAVDSVCNPSSGPRVGGLETQPRQVTSAVNQENL